MVGGGWRVNGDGGAVRGQVCMRRAVKFGSSSRPPQGARGFILGGSAPHICRRDKRPQYT